MFDAKQKEIRCSQKSKANLILQQSIFGFTVVVRFVAYF